MLDRDVAFVMVLLTGTRRGQGRAERSAYLSGRGVPNRAHVVLRSRAMTRSNFLRQGHRGRATRCLGISCPVVRLGADGLIASYQVTFDLEHVLVED